MAIRIVLLLLAIAIIAIVFANSDLVEEPKDNCEKGSAVRVVFANQKYTLPRSPEIRIREKHEIRRGSGHHICQSSDDEPFEVSSVHVMNHANRLQSVGVNNLNSLMVLLEDAAGSSLLPTSENVSGRIQNPEAYALVEHEPWLTEYRREISTQKGQNILSKYEIICVGSANPIPGCLDYTVVCNGDGKEKAIRNGEWTEVGRRCSTVYKSGDGRFFARIRMNELERPPSTWAAIPNEIERFLFAFADQ